MPVLQDNPCPQCKHSEGYSIHGRCNSCGYEKYPSATLTKRRIRRQ